MNPVIVKMKAENFSTKKLNVLFFSLSVISILLGGIIYILLRPSEPIFVEWFTVIGLNNWVDSIRETTVPFSEHFPEWFIYSLPNGLWAFAYSLIITVIWIQNNSVLKYLWMASIPILVIGFEILQYTGNIPGTFSMIDILLGITGIIAGFMMGKQLIKFNNYEKNKN